MRAMIQKLGIYIFITCSDAGAFVGRDGGVGGAGRSECRMWWVGTGHTYHTSVSFWLKGQDTPTTPVCPSG